MKKQQQRTTTNVIKYKPITDNQIIYATSIETNKITFCDGAAGTSKTMCPTLLGLKWLLEKKFEKLIITRPIIEAGQSIGHLPGDYEEKISPFLESVYGIIRDYIQPQTFIDLVSAKKIEGIPINYMRGRTFHNSFVIVDESQNCTYEQLVLVLTRFGKNAKMVLNADPTQSDLPDKLRGGFVSIVDKLKNINDIGIIHMTNEDIVREPIVRTILERLNP